MIKWVTYNQYNPKHDLLNLVVWIMCGVLGNPFKLYRFLFHVYLNLCQKWILDYIEKGKRDRDKRKGIKLHSTTTATNTIIS